MTAPSLTLGHDLPLQLKVRLDRALRDNKFMEQLGGSEVFHLPTTESDHAGLLVEVRHQEPA